MRECARKKERGKAASVCACDDALREKERDSECSCLSVSHGEKEIGFERLCARICLFGCVCGCMSERERVRERFHFVGHGKRESYVSSHVASFEKTFNFFQEKKLA